jgi:Flp pilus assembly protein TadG
MPESTSLYRFAITTAIILGLIAGSVATANYVYGVVRAHEAEVEAAAANAAMQTRIEANQRAAEEQQREAQERIERMNETAVVSLANGSTSGTVYLWTATPNGTNADGSTVYTYNEVCGALPGQSCSANVYVNRGVQVKISGSSWSPNNPNSQWEVVPQEGLPLTASDSK